jgi:hypothetical protein
MQMLVSEHCFTKRVPRRNEKYFFVENLPMHVAEENFLTMAPRQ